VALANLRYINAVNNNNNNNWQDFNWHDASRGPSAIAELLVSLYSAHSAPFVNPCPFTPSFCRPFFAVTLVSSNKKLCSCKRTARLSLYISRNPVGCYATVRTSCTTNPQHFNGMELEYYVDGRSSKLCASWLSSTRSTVNDFWLSTCWRNYVSSEFGTKFQREVPLGLFLDTSKFPYNTVYERWKKLKASVPKPARFVYPCCHSVTVKMSDEFFIFQQCGGQAYKVREAIHLLACNFSKCTST